MPAKLSPAKQALLAQRLKGKAAPQITIPRRDPKGPIPLSFAQQRLWFLTQLEPDNPFYNIPTALRLEGDLYIGAFQQAVDQLVQRHETLRTTFTTIDDQPQQIIHPQIAIPFEQVDLSALPANKQDQEVEQVAIAAATQPFDLSQGPLLRIKLLRLAPSQSVLLVTLHHIISDAWSTGILIRELAYFYQAALQSKPAHLPELPIQYADFSHWQRQQTDCLEQQLNYWQQQFATLPPALALPTDRSRPTVQTYRGDRCTIELSTVLTAQLKKLAQDTDSTLFMVLLASFQVLLHRYTHQTDITIGTPIANRNQTAIEGLIGFFINSLALRADLSGNPTFKQLLTQVRERTLGAYAHQDLPFEKLVDALEMPRDLSHSPLFQVMLILQNAPTATLDVPGVTLTPLHYNAQTTKFDLTLICVEQEETLTAVMEFNTDLFDAATIERMLGHWQTLLSGIVEHPQARLSELPLLSPTEQQVQQQTQTDYCLNVPLHYWIEAQVKRSPEAIAVNLASSHDGHLRSSSSGGRPVGGRHALTYQELNKRANQLAHHLQSLGVGPDVLVGISLERSLNLVIALLGILKAGGAYVPLDPDYPAERIAHMVADAQPLVIITGGLTEGVTSLSTPCLDLEQDWQQIAQQPSTRPQSTVNPHNLAYVIYTSGSTGKPKGAMNTHAAICNRLLWMQETFTLTADDVVLQKTPFSFDVSVWEFFWPLMTGARLVMAAPGGHRDNQYLSNCIQADNVSTIHFVPAMLRAFLDTPEIEQCTSLRTVIASGEALPVSVQHRFDQRLSAQLHNLYGPTEAAIDVSHWPCQPDNSQLSVPLGFAIANIQLYVLDPYLNPVPIGVPGELHIGGIGLARGYLNRPGLTAERFIPDPFCDGDRLYKTGDLVRFLPCGVLEFLGRMDHQVKLRGLRIELGEIEANLLQHQHLKAVVVLVQTAPSGAQQIVAYGVADTELTLAELQAWLQPKLPEYMVPSLFVPLEQLPLSPNGKIDRRALVLPEWVTQEYHSPQTETERLLAEIWSQLLQVETIGINDNFFELGGDSILSLQVVSRAVQAGIQITPKQLFQHQTIRSLAQVSGTVPVINAEQTVSGDSPLLPIQHWFLEQSLPNPDHWNQAVLLRVPQSLTFADLCQCVQQLLAHHDGLRSQFTTPPSTQIIPATADEIPFQEIDLTAYPIPEQTNALTQSAALIQSSITLSSVVQVVLFRLSGETNRLLITAHHLVIDGLSWRILLEDFQALLQHQPLPPKTCSIRQWHQQLLNYNPDTDYWQQQAPHNPLPMDFPQGSNTYGQRTTYQIQLSKEEATQLQAVPQAYRAQINDLLVTALVLAATQWLNQTQLQIDFESHGRADLGLDISRTVGWFTALYPMQFDVAGIADLDTALKTIKEQLRQVPDQGLGYGILRYLDKDKALQSHPAAAIRFNYLGQFEANEWLAPESIGPLHGPTNPCSHPLTVDAEWVAGQLQVRFGYSQAQYRPATIEQLVERFGLELRSLIRHCLNTNTLGYTPSDFPLTSIQQSQLDQLVATKGTLADLYPLSPTQQGLLFHSLYAPNSGLYISQFSYTLKGPLNTHALQQAWNKVIAQYPVLRTAFAWECLDQPYQYIKPECQLPWTNTDLTDSSSQNPHHQSLIAPILYEDRVKGFALDQAPLMRLQLIRLDPDTHELIWTFHHLILDGWSLPIVLQSVFQQYSAIENQQSFPLPTSRSFRDYIQWLGEQDQDQAQRYWHQLLQGVTAPTPLGGKTDKQGSRADREQGYTCIEHHLSTEVATALETFCSHHHLTLNTLVQGAWAMLLSRISNCTDVVFGATTSGRSPELMGAEQMVGVLINTLPVRVQIKPELSLLSWLQKLQEQQSSARQYEYCSLAQIQQTSAIPQGTPLFESLVVFENYPVDASTFQAIQTSIQLLNFKSTANNSYPLTVRVLPGQPLKLDMMVDLHRFKVSQVEDWLQQLATLLQGMAKQPRTVGDVLSHLDAIRQVQQGQQRQSLLKASLGKLKRTRRKAVAPNSPEAQS